MDDPRENDFLKTFVVKFKIYLALDDSTFNSKVSSKREKNYFLLRKPYTNYIFTLTEYVVDEGVIKLNEARLFFQTNQILRVCDVNL
ncbi:MAG: hypothetical protein ACTSWN_06285 [Promethearchaeota archaeon]